MAASQGGPSWPPSHGIVFQEVFSGVGALSAAVRQLEVRTLCPQDASFGGIDIMNDDAVGDLVNTWAKCREEGLHILFHFGTPCSSFSRARDRSSRTRVRSDSQPWGLDQEHVAVAAGETQKL